MISNRKKSKVFLDSSVFIAAAVSATGYARTLIMQGMRGQGMLVVSDLVLEETRRNLTLKVPQALEAFELFLQTLQPEVVNPPILLIEQCMTHVHAKDAPIVAAALAAQADWIVSYDQKHLLVSRGTIVEHFGVRIGTPDEYLRANEQT